ncbi:hypothetical protein M8C21_015117 [Ambrosia artemisiifolia]|uniref:PGG domain-containing protein n=1 Tax=Ambrosia artemisiifolia TaxID=4212 RepID=A0AAD5D3R5_AMBAR|nr:hypothetical protein M8C21_015117 [Ambrosia artemisiifolia]
MDLLRIVWENISTMNKSKIDDILRGRPLWNENAIKGYPSRVLFLAVKMGNTSFVIELIRSYPDLIWEQDDKGKTIFHLAAKQRQAEIYNLLYETGGRKKLIIRIEDKNGNNILHMAGMRPKHTYRKAYGGAAIQLQQELLWFTHVWLRIPRHYTNKKNKAGETPLELFSRTHADLLTEAKKWMKETSAQCMVATTLITTIVFTSAFTLPGGYNQNNGIPFFRKEPSFIIFVIADAVSLVSASTSVLLFLSILTSGYGEDEFFASLPSKLANGLITLFLSVLSMLVAFAANFFVLYNKDLEWMPVTITCLASFPVILFVILQYRLFKNVFYSNYRLRSNFRPKRILYN